MPDKVLLPLAGRPMLAWVLDAIEGAEAIGVVVVVVGAHTREAVEALVGGGAWPKVGSVVAGGERRQDSVAAGVAAVPDGVEVVVVHDGARPLASSALFDRCAAAGAGGAAIAAVPVVDTLKRVAAGRVAATVDRAGLWAAQTPQAFRPEVLREAIARCAGLPAVTDEAGLCEAVGIPVAVVRGEPANLKVTRPEDVAVAEALLRARGAPSPASQLGGGVPTAPPEAPEAPPPRSPHDRVPTSISASIPKFGAGGGRFPRTGTGYDVHRFAPGRRLVLGGVVVPHPVGLDGHSDADVLLHAIADALLGAAALGDIGRHFPPSDPRFAGVDSRVLLAEVGRLVAAAGFAPVNVDATVVAEVPRIGPYVAAMRAAIGACLGLGEEAVGVKATTNEGMGFVGRGEGIAALAVATIVPVSAADGG